MQSFITPLHEISSYFLISFLYVNVCVFMLYFHLIIIGATNRNTSPDGQTSVSYSNVLAAAQTLAMILQQSGNMAPSPDPITAGIINTWLETHLPVSSNNNSHH